MKSLFFIAIIIVIAGMWSTYAQNVGTETKYHFNNVIFIPIQEPIISYEDMIMDCQKTNQFLSAYKEYYSLLKNTDNKTKEKGEWNLGYLNLPVIMKFNLSKSFRFLLGPQVGYLLNFKHTNILTGQTYSYTSTDLANKFDMGIASGAMFKLGNGLFFEGRYTLGLTDDASNGDNYFNIDTKHFVFSFGIGYMF